MMIAHDTAEALAEIVGGISKATTLVGEIATASNEQASGVSQFNQAVKIIWKIPPVGMRNPPLSLFPAVENDLSH